MRELVPIEAYGETARSLSLVRMGLSWGIVGGLLFGLVMWFLLRAPSGACPCPPALLFVASGLLFGVGTGALGPYLVRKRLIEQSLAAARAEGKFATPVPQGPFSHRMSCNLRHGRWAIGGSLFVGPGCATFVPHRFNLPQHRGEIQLASAGQATVSLRPQPRSLAGATVARSLPDLLQITSPDGTWIFAAPEPALVATRLQDLLSRPPKTRPPSPSSQRTSPG